MYPDGRTDVDEEGRFYYPGNLPAAGRLRGRSGKLRLC